MNAGHAVIIFVFSCFLAALVYGLVHIEGALK